jgi:hypothetical protein
MERFKNPPKEKLNQKPLQFLVVNSSHFQRGVKRMNKADEVTGNEKGLEALVDIWRQLITDDTKPWALFQNGTVVVLEDPAENIAQAAVSIMKGWGQVSPGTPSGDFTVFALNAVPGWVVTSHFVTGFDLLTYVSPKELADDNPPADAVGLLGREKRERDAAELVIVHICAIPAMGCSTSV